MSAADWVGGWRGRERNRVRLAIGDVGEAAEESAAGVFGDLAAVAGVARVAVAVDAAGGVGAGADGGVEAGAAVDGGRGR